MCLNEGKSADELLTAMIRLAAGQRGAGRLTCDMVEMASGVSSSLSPRRASNKDQRRKHKSKGEAGRERYEEEPDARLVVRGEGCDERVVMHAGRLHQRLNRAGGRPEWYYWVCKEKHKPFKRVVGVGGHTAIKECCTGGVLMQAPKYLARPKAQVGIGGGSGAGVGLVGGGGYEEEIRMSATCVKRAKVDEKEGDGGGGGQAKSAASAKGRKRVKRNRGSSAYRGMMKRRKEKGGADTD
jgi:hypothetical protein